jgi:uncharacterized protein (TIGR03083 family)
MTSLVDRTIAALRAEHDVLVTLIPELDLSAQSGAADWTLAQVISHLGSGAEIGRASIARAAGEDVPPADAQAIWARWDAATPIDQAAGYVEHGSRWLETAESVPATASVDMGFLPEPIPLAAALGMRLNEVANHVWDVRVALDPSAEVSASSAAVLVEQFAGPLAFLLGFSGKADQVAEPVRLAVPGGGVVIEDAVSMTPSLTDATATLTGAPGAAVRLLSGRLRAPYDSDVAVTGNVTLDDLRRVFPGY